MQSGSAYTGFTTSKGLTIVGQARPNLTSPVRVESLPAGEELVLRGFDLTNFGPSFVSVASCAGVVWIEDCPIMSVCFFCSGGNVVQVQDSQKVVWIRGDVETQLNLAIGSSNFEGLRLDDASLFAFESGFDGWDGKQAAGWFRWVRGIGCQAPRKLLPLRERLELPGRSSRSGTAAPGSMVPSA